MTQRLRVIVTTVAAVLLALPVGASAQAVPVTVEVGATEQPTGPVAGPTDPSSPPADPSDTPPPGEQPPPAAAVPPDDPLARTGAHVLRTVRDAAALIAAGLLLLIATREPRRERG